MSGKYVIKKKKGSVCSVPSDLQEASERKREAFLMQIPPIVSILHHKSTV